MAKVTINHMRWKSSTLNDLESHWQPVESATLATAGLFCYIVMSSLTIISEQKKQKFQETRVLGSESSIYGIFVPES